MMQSLIFFRNSMGYICLSKHYNRVYVTYGLKRRQPDYNIDEIRELIQEKLRGPACMGGYPLIWHALRISGYLWQAKLDKSVSRLACDG